MTDWFVSDWHFYHQKIIGYCDRPYHTEPEMRKDIIDRHNSVVRPKDTVYVIGDCGMLGRDKLSKLRPILNKMHGVKHLILGNHDEGKPFTYERIGFTTVHTALELRERGPNGEPIYLRHDPAACNVAPDAVWIVGHVHRLFHYTTTPIKCYNVSVEVNDFYPVTLDHILTALYKDDRPVEEAVQCGLCKQLTSKVTARLHQNKFIGDCCWDDRLKITE